MSFQLLFTCASADERLEVADERLEGCQHYAFKEYKNANGVRILGGTLMEPFSGSGSSLLDAQRLVAIPSTCQSTDFEGEIPRYTYLKYVVFQR